MAIIVNGTTIPTGGNNIKVNNVNIEKVYANNVLVWESIPMNTNMLSEFAKVGTNLLIGGYSDDPDERDFCQKYGLIGVSKIWRYCSGLAYTNLITKQAPSEATKLRITLTYTATSERINWVCCGLGNSDNPVPTDWGNYNAAPSFLSHYTVARAWEDTDDNSTPLVLDVPVSSIGSQFRIMAGGSATNCYQTTTAYISDIRWV